MEIIQALLSKVEVWEKNLKVRATKKEGYEQTKSQIVKLDVFKPVTAYPENGKYYILGGRLRYFVIRDLGHEKIDISVVYPKDEAEKWEYVFADNDQPSIYLDQELVEEIFEHAKKIDMSKYGINKGQSVKLSQMVEGFAPGGTNEQTRLDKIAEKAEVKCPNCELVFIP